MKLSKRWSIALGALAMVAAVPVLSSTPVFAELTEAGTTLVQAILRPEVKLNLVAQKQVITVDEKTGRQIVTWKGLEDGAIVQPGDLLQYVVSGNNAGEAAAKNLVVTQAIPQAMIYVLQSAQSNNGAEITYSIDNGETFVTNPTIEETLPDGTVAQQPAPAEAYTHIRWKFSQLIAPEDGVKAVYQVKVR